MKVALVTTFPSDPLAPHGGVEAVSVNLACGLVRSTNVDVQVVTCDPKRKSVQSTRWNGCGVHRLPRGEGSTLRNALGEGRRMIQDYLSDLQPDVVHAHDTYGLMVQGLRLPRAFTIHGFIHADTVLAGGRLARLRAMVWRHYETAGWADQPHIISISPYVRERLRGIARGVIHDIDNPIAEACFEVQRKEQPGRIFSAALICRRKNTLGLVEAFAKVASRHPESTLRLAGGVSEPDYAAAVRRRIEELRLSERVELIGSISTQQVREELAKASLFALVSLEEGSPMGIEEAMAVGVPVVTSNRCGMPYMVKDTESGFLVDPHDADDIAWRLDQLLADADLRSRTGAVGRQIALERFHPGRVAARTLEVYERAMRGHHRSNGKP